MKSKKIFRAVFAAVAIAAVFSGCSFLDKDDDDDDTSSQKGRLLFSVDSSARAVNTITPTAGFDFANDAGLTFTLTGKISEGTSKTLGSWGDSSSEKAYSRMTADNSILVDTGSWTFRLSVTKDSDEVLFGTLKTKIVAGDNTLDFGTLSEASSTDETRDSSVSVAKGSVSFKLSFPADSGVLGATASLGAIGETASGETASGAAPLEITTSGTTSSVTYSESADAGNYVLAIKLYSNATTLDSTTYLNTYTALVNVAPGRTSAGSAELTDINTLCTVKYERNGGSFEGTVQTTYNKHAKITLPTPAKTGYDFAGWAISENGEKKYDGGTEITIAELGENTTLYAIWLPNGKIDASLVADYISKLTEDSTVTVTGELTEELLKEIASAIKSGSCKITLDLSNTTGLTKISDASEAADGIFYNNTNLLGIVLPDTLTYIGSYTFYGCTAITNMVIPDTVKSIGASVFGGCASLTEITIPFVGSSADATKASSSTLFGYIFGTTKYDGGTSTEQYYTKESFQQYYIPATLKKVTVTGGKILYGAFYNCTCLASITILGSVEKIGTSAFWNCMSLESVTIPDSVTSIRAKVFYNCTSLASVTIPDGVTSIGGSAFRSCTSLASVTIPDGVTSIGDSAFRSCTSLTSVTIPGKVTSIEESAFRSCTSLASVTIPDSVTSIGDSAFSSCTSLASVTIPGSVTSIDGDAFSSCTSLASVTIPDSVTSIGEWAFGWCGSLASVAIPDSVTSIGNSAFYGCTSLTSVTIQGKVTSIEEFTFHSCTSLASVTIPDSVTSIGDYAFYGCTSLASMTIPGSVTSIGEWAFRGCTSLASMTIPGSVTSIGDSAFRSCTSLANITIPDSVTSIGSDAFGFCTSLASVTIGNGVTSIGSSVFHACTSLTNITVSADNKSYDSRNACNAIIETSTNTLVVGCKNTVIPDSVTSIGSYAFYYCKNLTSVTIPDSVTSIGEWAFSDCTSLASVAIPGSVTSIGSYAFSGCNTLTSVTFNDKETWYYNGTAISSTDLADTSIAAKYLKDTYAKGSWSKK